MNKYLLFILTSIFSLQVTLAQTSPTFSFHINGTVPAGFSQALDEAGKRWSKYLNITVPIKVNVVTFNYGNLVDASAITITNGRQNFANAPVSNVLYPSSLANQLAGTELNTGEYDMDIYINMYISYYYGTGKPANNQYDFTTLAMHEIGHGLGFYSIGYVDANNVGSFGNVPLSALVFINPSFPWHGQDGVPCIFDKYIVKPSTHNLVGMAANNTVALGDSIKNGLNYFDGPNFANSSNGGNPVKLSGGTGTFNLGVDLLHVHTSIQNSIMSYSWGYGDTVRKPATWEMGILNEIGWQSKQTSVNEFSNLQTLHCYPNPATNELHIEGNNIKSISVVNIQGQLLHQQSINKMASAIKLDIGDWNTGMYFLSVEYNTGQKAVKKIAINR